MNVHIRRIKRKWNSSVSYLVPKSLSNTTIAAALVSMVRQHEQSTQRKQQWEKVVLEMP